MSALLRGQFELGIASVVRQRQHFGKECRVLAWRRILRQQSIEFIELRLRSVVVRQSSGTFRLADDGIERTVRVHALPRRRWHGPRQAWKVTLARRASLRFITLAEPSDCALVFFVPLTVNRLGEREIAAMIDGVIGNKPLPANAYRRSNMLDKRRPMMQAYAAFATSACTEQPRSLT